MRVDGKLFDVPLDIYPNVVIYNLDIFDRKGVEYPKPSWTWDDFRSKALTLTETDGDRFETYGAVASFVWLWQTMNTSFPEGRNSIELSDTTLRETFQLWLDLVRNRTMFDSELSNRGKRRVFPFRSGKAGMEITSFPTTVFRMMKNTHVRWGLVPLPGLAGKEKVTPLEWAYSIGILKSSHHPKEAWEVIRLLTGPQGSRFIAASGRIPAFLTDESFEVWKRITKLLQGFVPEGVETLLSRPMTFRIGRKHAQPNTQMYAAMYTQSRRLLDGEISAAQALDHVIKRKHDLLLEQN